MAVYLIAVLATSPYPRSSFSNESQDCLPLAVSYIVYNDQSGTVNPTVEKLFLRAC